MKTEIEEAVVESETQLVLQTEFTTPVLAKVLDKDKCINTIKGVREKYAKVVIADTKDKDNYKLVVVGISELRTSRLAWVKSVKETVLDPAKSWVKDLGDSIKEIEEEFKSGEEELKGKKDAIDKLKADEKAEEERKKTERLTGRIEKLMTLGAKNTGANYTFEYDLSLFVPVFSLKDMDDAKFDKQLKSIQLAFDAEEKRKQDEANAATLLAEQNKAASEQLAAKQRKLRIKELTLTGFEQDVTGAWKLNEIEVSDSAIDNIPDEDWDHLMEIALQEPTAKEDDNFDFTPTQVDLTAQAVAIEATEQEEDFEFTPTAVSNTTTVEAVERFEATPIETEEVKPIISEDSYIRSFVFTKDKPYISFAVGQGTMTQVICDTAKIDVVVEKLGLSQFESGEVNGQLSFILFKTM